MALLLGGCDNYVVSDKPWFEVKDGGGAEIRFGWWAVKDDHCRFEVGAPSTSWPECAEPLLISQDWKGSLSSLAPDGVDYLLVSGKPLILQYGVKGLRDGDKASDAYFYFGIEPQQRDGQGRLVALKFWPALCGPPPPPDRKAPYRSRATKKPWPGMTLTSGGVCTAADVNALRKAVLRSGRLVKADDENMSIRWLRERRSGDQSEADWLAVQGIRTQ
ncbi:MAG TPA: hypothetical protein VNZ85_06760 [Caulobacter sp.]|nr:hypothetical protein [Caulobacter sp.]